MCRFTAGCLGQVLGDSIQVIGEHMTDWLDICNLPGSTNCIKQLAL